MIKTGTSEELKQKNEITSVVTTDCDFKPVTPKKFLGCDGKMSDRDRLLLSTGFKYSVDDFDYHYSSAWFPSFKRPQIVKKPKMLKKKTLKRSTRVKDLSVDQEIDLLPKPDLMLTSQDVALFMASVDDAMKNPFIRESRFLRRGMKNAIFCGLSQCKHCLSNSSVESAEQVKEQIVPASIVEASNNHERFDFRGNTQEERARYYSLINRLALREYVPFVDTLLREGIESNPGPTMVGCHHKQSVYNCTFSVYSVASDDVFGYTWALHVLHKPFGVQRVVKRQADVCYTCRRRWFCIEFTSCEKVEDLAFRISHAFINHPAFGFDFCREHLYPNTCEEEYCRNLLREGIESNPGPETLNGNTKRKSKSNKCIVPTLERMQRLAQRDDAIGRSNSVNAKDLITQRRQNAAHKAIMKQLFPTTQSLFSIDINHNFGVVNQIQELVDSLPYEFKQAIVWADVVASIRVLLSSCDWSAKYLAFRILYREFSVSGVDAQHLLASLVGVLSLCAIHTDNIPVKQNMTFDEKFDPISTFVTVMLTFLFGQKPGQNRVDHLMDGLGHIPRRSLGLAHLLEVVKRCLSYVCGVTDPNVSLEQQINIINERVTYWLSREGDNFIMTNPNGFDEVTKTVNDATEVERCLISSPHLRRMFSPTLFQLRKIHNRVIQAPVSGHAFRKEPVVLHIVGDPGMGKTLMINAISSDSLKCIFDLNGMPLNEQQEKLRNFFQFVYWRPIGHKYETNYNTSQSKIYVVDDANQVSADYLHDDLPFPARLIHYANNADLLLPVAEIENKRTAKFNSDLIIATDNEKVPDLHYLQSPDAYLRRIDISAKVSLASEFTTTVNGVRVADPTKFAQDHFDTSAYRFEIDGKMHNYDELMSLIQYKLKEKHVRFTLNRTNFVKYATRHFEAVPTCVNDASEEDLLVTQSKNSRVVRTSQRGKNLFFPFCGVLFAIFTFSFFREKKVSMAELKARLTFFCCGLYIRGRERVRNFWQTDRVSLQRKLFYIASAGVLLCTSYKLYTTFSGKGNATTEGYSSGDATRTVRKPKNKPRGNLTALRKQNETIVHTRFDASEFSNSPTTESCLDNAAMSLCRKLTSSMYEITVVNTSGISSKIHGMFISGRIFMCNAHVLDHCQADFDESLISLEGLRNSFLDIRGSSINVWQIGHDDESNEIKNPYDVVFLEFDRTVSDHVNFSKHFISKSRYDTLKGVKIIVCSLVREGRGANATWVVHQQHTHVRELVDDWIVSLKDGQPTVNYGGLEYAAQTLDGYCGSIIVINDAKYPDKVCGMHMASFEKTDVCYGANVTKEMIECILSSCSNESTFGFESLSVKQNLLTKRTVIDNDLEHVTCIPHMVHAQKRTKIAKSVLHGVISEVTKMPAVLGYCSVDDVRFHVVNRAMKKYIGPSIFIDDSLRNVFQAFLRKRFSSTRTVKEFDVPTAIRGIEGNEFVQAINRSSSPGYPFVKFKEMHKPGKTTFLGSDENFIYDHPLLLSEIQKYKDMVKNGDRPLCFFTSTAKDELRSLDRVAQGKTRSFAAAPLHFVVLFRQKFLDLFANIMENRIQNSSLVGINPFSQEWDLLCYRMNKIAPPHKKQFLAGDFSNFDGTLNRSLLWEIHNFLEEEYHRTGDMLSYSLWCDITNSLQVFGDCAIGVSRGQPSGNPGTTIINSLYNSALLYTVLYSVLTDVGAQACDIQQNLPKHFDSYVYGDDNIMVFSEELSELLDPRLISKKMLEFGHVYTSDAKDDSELRYRTMFDISILKRHFSYDNKIRKWLAPLDLSSILEPLNWDRIEDGQEEVKKDQMSINARTAIRELSMHSKEVFDTYVPRILKACSRFNIPLDIDCFFNQHNLRCLLKNLEVQLPKQESRTNTSPIVGDHAFDSVITSPVAGLCDDIGLCETEKHTRRDIYLERLGGQPLPNRFIPPDLQNDLTASS